MGELWRKLLPVILLVTIIISFGTIGYMLIEGWGLLDSLYMTVITLSTVGFKEVGDLSTSGRLFTIILIIGGVGTVLYALGKGARFILEGELQEAFGRRILEKKVKGLKDHYIICGFGRMGKIIGKELKNRGVEFIAIEKNPIPYEKEEMLILEGDATQDDVLKESGIEKAKGLITVLSTDAENLYVVLSAKGLNPGLYIVARAGEEGSEQKLLRAGADRVISPYLIGGLRIAHTVLKPAVVDFIEFATKAGNIDLQMEEITIPESSGLIGLTLDQCGMGRELGIIVVAIKRATGEMRFNPTFRTTIKLGDTLIVLGEVSKLKILEEKVLAQK
jgi:voltage-gated potassium channel